ncbi:MAG: histidine kinase [Bacteroidota bacterium]
MTVGLLTSALWLAMWKGNEAVSGYLDSNLSWQKTPKKRLIASTIGHSVYTILAMIMMHVVGMIVYNWPKSALSFKAMVNESIPALIITLIIVTFLTARSFLMSWRQSAINEEKMKREVIATRFAALKNQVNPHFLFNSLNVLSSLVYKDADLSAKFIKKLSNVYRYVLEVQDKELTDIDSELEFLQSFTFLLKIRHSEGLNVKVDIPKNSGYQVAPLALQMLVENAVKHNVINGETPLNIDISTENGYLVVKNNLQKKMAKKEDGTSIGLANIRERYGFFTEKPMTFGETDGFYEVKLPLLKLDK